MRRTHNSKQTSSTGRLERPADRVERAYASVKSMAVDYKLRPGEPVRETELSRQLKISRTPIREALNRLVVEDLLSFVPNRGFFCREISSEEIRALYETRAILEIGAVRLALRNATDEQIEDACRKWEDVATRSVSLTAAQLAEADEEFHQAIAALSKNSSIVKVLGNINVRLRFFRTIANENPVCRKACVDEHERLIEAIRARKTQEAVKRLQKHINAHSEMAAEVIKEGLARIYLRSA